MVKTPLVVSDVDGPVKIKAGQVSGSSSFDTSWLEENSGMVVVRDCYPAE
jgi:hypothetical protein